MVGSFFEQNDGKDSNMEKYGEVPPRFTKKWWGHIWEYYKWHFIITAVAILIAVVTIVQCAHRTEYDVVMIYAGHKDLSNMTQNQLYELATEHIDDVDGNGKVVVDIKPLVFTDIDGNEDYDFAIQTKLDLTFVDDYTYIYLMDETQARVYCGRKDTTDAFEEVSAYYDDTGKEVLYTTDENRSFAVSLKDSALLKEKGINADGLYMMVRRDNKASEKNTKSHDSAIKFAKELVR